MRPFRNVYELNLHGHRSTRLQYAWISQGFDVAEIGHLK